MLHAEGSPAEQVAAHVMRIRAAGDPWVVLRLREAARVALESGTPAASAGLLDRALIGEGNVSASSGHRQHDGPPDSPAAAGDETNLSP